MTAHLNGGKGECKEKAPHDLQAAHFKAQPILQINSQPINIHALISCSGECRSLFVTSALLDREGICGGETVEGSRIHVGILVAAAAAAYSACLQHRVKPQHLHLPANSFANKPLQDDMA